MDELNFNGYEYVDLGLPSGTLWAKCNVGAEKESDYGLYFQWGDVVGYGEDQVGSGEGKKYFYWSDYIFGDACDGSLTKYCSSSKFGVVDNKTILDLEDDAASVNMGGSWRMPSSEEYLELINYTTYTRTTVNGVTGILFTGNNGNTLFFPASGYCVVGDVYEVGSYGYYWSSSLCSEGLSYWLGFISNNYCGIKTDSRCYGYTVRGVISNGSGTTTTTTSTSTTSTTTTSTTSTTTTSTTPGPDDTTTTTTTTTSTTSTTTPKPPYSPSTGKKPSHLFVFSSESDYNQVKENLTKPNVSYIKDINKVSYKSKPKENYNGHEYVDLGLPSGLKWAKCNVGAEKESDYGLYFQWGDVVGYGEDQVGSGEGKKYFYWSDYIFGDACDGSLTKYCSSSKFGVVDNKTILDLEDDAASVNMGGSWHMPNKEQFEELINTSYTTTTWTTVNGVYGRKITSKTNGNTLFLPASGCCKWGFVNYVGSYGYCWSSSLYGIARNAWYLFFSLGDIDGGEYNRYCGYPVRGVIE